MSVCATHKMVFTINYCFKLSVKCYQLPPLLFGYCKLFELQLYTLLFFPADEVTRDYVAPITEPLLRDCSLLSWFPDKLEDENWIKQLTSERATELVREELSAMQKKV